MSEIEQVRAEMDSVKEELTKAKNDGLPIDNPGVIALNQRLTELQKKENILLQASPSTGSGDSFLCFYQFD